MRPETGRINQPGITLRGLNGVLGRLDAYD